MKFSVKTVVEKKQKKNSTLSCNGSHSHCIHLFLFLGLCFMNISTYAVILFWHFFFKLKPRFLCLERFARKISRDKIPFYLFRVANKITIFRLKYTQQYDVIAFALRWQSRFMLFTWIKVINKTFFYI